MKKIAIFLVTLCLSFSTVLAGDESWEAPKYGEVQSYDFNLELEVDGSSVLANWNAFPGDKDLKWYKLVYSQDNENLSYPEDDAYFVGYNAAKNSEKIWLKAGKSYYIRLCAITHENERYCSKVKKVEVAGKEYPKTQYKEYKTTTGEYKKTPGVTVKKAVTKNVVNKKKDYKNYDATKKDVKKKYTDKKSYGLSEKMKDRIDNALKNFIERLEKKGYSDEQMAEVIEKVIDRMEGLKKQDRYALLADYIILVLEEYLEEYSDDFSEIESILEEF